MAKKFAGRDPYGHAETVSGRGHQQRFDIAALRKELVTTQDGGAGQGVHDAVNAPQIRMDCIGRRVVSSSLIWGTKNVRKFTASNYLGIVSLGESALRYTTPLEEADQALSLAREQNDQAIFARANSNARIKIGEPVLWEDTNFTWVGLELIPHPDHPAHHRQLLAERTGVLTGQLSAFEAWSGTEGEKLIMFLMGVPLDQGKHVDPLRQQLEDIQNNYAYAVLGPLCKIYAPTTG